MKALADRVDTKNLGLFHRLIRPLAGTALFCSLGLLLALWVGAVGQSEGSSSRIEPNPLRIPGEMRSGKHYDFDVEVVNESDEPIRIVGAGDYCASSCYSGRGIPTVIPARGRGRVIVHIEAGVPGVFSEELTYYTDRPSQPTLVIKLEGMVQDLASRGRE